MSFAQAKATRWIRFEREADMLAVIDAHRRNIVRGCELDVYFEVQTLHGVVDIILVEIDRAALDERHRLQAGPLTDWTAASVVHLLASAPRRTKDVPEMATILGVGAGHLRRVILPGLQQSGWIEEVKRGAWMLINPYLDPIRRMIAIEAKREGWRRALTQAAPHVEFADATYVALDGSRNMKVAELEGAFALAGVGLLAVHATDSTVSDPSAGQVKRIISPARKRRRNAIRTTVAERVMALHQSGVRSGQVNHVFGQLVTTCWSLDPRLTT